MFVVHVEFIVLIIKNQVRTQDVLRPRHDVWLGGALVMTPE